MAKQKFGSAHTEKKLVALEAYLRAYTTALKKQDFRLAFFDGFAGTGQIELSGDDAPLLGLDADLFIEGSARRALQCDPPFDEYVFVEKAASKVRDLHKLWVDFPNLASRIRIEQGDANEKLKEFCGSRDWQKTRAVVLLDPYGNQVEWSTIVTVANTRGIDLWYLFPAGPGVHRQISRRGTVHETHEGPLDRLMGTSEWRTAFLEKRRSEDLFEGTRDVAHKVATPESITLFMIKRMKSVFEGGVLDEWLPLRSRGIEYSLLFAWANPSEKAKLAGKLAAAVLKGQKRGRS